MPPTTIPKSLPAVATSRKQLHKLRSGLVPGGSQTRRGVARGGHVGTRGPVFIFSWFWTSFSTPIGALQGRSLIMFFDFWPGSKVLWPGSKVLWPGSKVLWSQIDFFIILDILWDPVVALPGTTLRRFFDFVESSLRDEWRDWFSHDVKTGKVYQIHVSSIRKSQFWIGKTKGFLTNVVFKRVGSESCSTVAPGSVLGGFWKRNGDGFGVEISYQALSL